MSLLSSLKGEFKFKPKLQSKGKRLLRISSLLDESELPGCVHGPGWVSTSIAIDLRRADRRTAQATMKRLTGDNSSDDEIIRTKFLSCTVIADTVSCDIGYKSWTCQELQVAVPFLW